MLQFRSNTGVLLLTEDGSLANECCCLVPDLTAIMRSLSEARHYIATQNGINQEFGGAQGTAWPTQRTSPFDAPPSDGEDIPPDFYQEDYLDNLQYAYDDLQTIIDNYNYIKNFFQKTVMEPGPINDVENFSPADDYNPGVITAANFETVRSNIIALVNDLLRVTVSATTTDRLRRFTSASFSAAICDVLICCPAQHPATPLGRQIQYMNGCILQFDIAAVNNTIGVRSIVQVNGGATSGFCSARNDTGTITTDLSNFTQGVATCYIKLDRANPADVFGQTQRPIAANENVYGEWANAAFVVGGVQVSPVVDFSNTDPDVYAPCLPGINAGISWEITNQFCQLVRTQNFPAS